MGGREGELVRNVSSTKIRSPAEGGTRSSPPDGHRSIMFKRRRLTIPTITQARASSSFQPSIQQAHQIIVDRDHGEGGIHAFVWTNDREPPSTSASRQKLHCLHHELDRPRSHANRSRDHQLLTWAAHSCALSIASEPVPTSCPLPSSTPPLSSLPIAVKDTFVTGLSIPTTASSKLLQGQ